MPVIEDTAVVIFTSLWLLLPAFMANPAAVLTGGGFPIDMGRKWKDGKRVLGPGKTWRGLAGGIAAGMGIGFLQELMVEAGLPLPGFGDFPQMVLVLFSLSFGALFGDAVKSFIKRRMDLAQGAHSPYLMDQLDFILGAWLMAALISPSWFFGTFKWYHALSVIIITPSLHRLTNILAYRMGQKEVPW